MCVVFRTLTTVSSRNQNASFEHFSLFKNKKNSPTPRPPHLPRKTTVTRRELFLVLLASHAQLSRAQNNEQQKKTTTTSRLVQIIQNNLRDY